jgi:hypothetical protein
MNCVRASFDLVPSEHKQTNLFLLISQHRNQWVIEVLFYELIRRQSETVDLSDEQTSTAHFLFHEIISIKTSSCIDIYIYRTMFITGKCVLFYVSIGKER